MGDAKFWTDFMKHSAAPPAFAAPPLTQIRQIRQQIASIAARYVCEDGATYAIAKQKAAQQVLGTARYSRDFLPDNSLMEQQVHLHNQLFLAHTQPQRLLHLRRLALQVMQELAQFNPHLSGAVLNGTAGEHAGILIQLFVDSNKDVAIYLLNQGVQFDVSESHQDPGRMHAPLETLSFMRDSEAVHLVLFCSEDLRRLSARKSPRANIATLQKIIEESLSS